MKTFKSPFLGQLSNIPSRAPGAVKALPKRFKVATYDDLKKSIMAHFKETEDQLTKLERMFHSVGKKRHGEDVYQKVKVSASGCHIIII